MRAKKSARRYIALVLAALVAVPLSLTGLWVDSKPAQAAAGDSSEIDYAGVFSSLTTQPQGAAGAGGRAIALNDKTFTVEAWVRPSPRVNDNYMTIVGHGLLDSGCFTGRFGMFLQTESTNPNNFKVHIAAGSGCGVTTIPHSVAANQWSHVATVINDSTWTIYVNGELVYTATNTWGPTVGETVTLGGTQNGKHKFLGSMDQVKVWNSPLNQSQIQSSMHAFGTPAGMSGLTAHYDFNEGTGVDVYNRVNTSQKLIGNGFSRSDVKTSSVNPAGETTLTFSRTYLPGVGGWKTPPGANVTRLLVVGGGGAGGAGNASDHGGGGGGGGQVLAIDNPTISSISTLRVGLGGVATAAQGLRGSIGQESVFGSSSALGGGGGGGYTQAPTASWTGGGGAAVLDVGTTANRAGAIPSAGRGFAGGSGSTRTAGGGGGAGGAGANHNATSPADGGLGITSDISGESFVYGAGGGGGETLYLGGAGGSSVGPGSGGGAGLNPGTSGQSSFGAGGGGGNGADGANYRVGGAGGSGVVILTYLDQRVSPAVTVGDLRISGALNTVSTAAVARDASNNPVAGSWSFTSSSTSIATVSNSGEVLTVTAVTRGVSRITTTFNPTSSDVFRTVQTTSLVVVEDSLSCGTQSSNVTNNSVAVAGTKDCYVRFTQGTGTWTVPKAVSALRLLIIGGGGSGGSGTYGGGGGAGAMREVDSYSVSGGAQLSVTVGAGGPPANVTAARGINGADSVFHVLTSRGGGGGGGYGWNSGVTSLDNAGYGNTGGSSGGTGEIDDDIPFPISYVAVGSNPNPGIGLYSQNTGGRTEFADSQASGGGGGAGDKGQDSSGSQLGRSGAGGPGKASDITGGTPITYAGGGGGGTGVNSSSPNSWSASAASNPGPGAGGTGGGGRGGSAAASFSATGGQENTGSGGGGAGGSSANFGGAGGSGVVIARYTRAEPTITQADISRVLTAGVLSLTPTAAHNGISEQGTFSYSIADATVATVDGSGLRPLKQGATTLAITFTPTDQTALFPTTKFVAVTISSLQTVPDSPLAVGAVKGTSSDEAVISWSAPSNDGGSTISAYTVTSNPGGQSCATATLSCSITGLVPGVTYVFSVIATNATGNSNPAISNALSLIAPIPIGAVCSPSLAAQNGISVEPAHGTVMYIDTGQGQSIDAGYIGYRVKSASARQDLWVEVSGFTGGVVSLANAADKALPLGVLTAGETGTAYYLVRATGATNVAQGHKVKVYSGKPTIGSPSPIFECGFSFVQVAETIKAAANKVDSIVSTQVRSIGSTMTITVLGDSGTIGQGNSIDGRMFSLIPAARSNWPTGALRLEEVKLQLYSNSARSTLLSEHTDQLRVSAATGLTSTSRQYYRATYTFRIIGSAAAAAPIIPIAMISSGTQIKHTDVGSLPTGGSATVNVTQPPVDMRVVKSASTTSVVSEDGTTALSYTISLQNSGTNTLVVDEVIDSPDSVMTFKQASARFDGAAISDAGTLASGKYAFSGPFEVPAGQTKTLTYQMFTTTCAPGGSYDYDNIATAQVGSVIIGSAAATQSVVTVGGKCGVPEVVVEVQNVPIPPEVQTATATNITTTSATLRGVVDPNGTVGLEVRILYSTHPALTSALTVDLDRTVASAIGYPVSTNVAGLMPGLTYYYRTEVRSTLTGPYILGEILSFTMEAAPGGAAVATTLRANEITTTSARIFGSVDPDNVPGGAKVRFDLGLDGSGNGTCSVAPASVSTGTVLRDDEVAPVQEILATGSSPIEFNVNLLELTPATAYCFRIVAIFGNSYSEVSNGNWMPFSTVANIVPQVLAWGATLDRSGEANDPLVELEPGSGSTVTVQVDSSGAGSSALVQFRSDSPEICSVNATTGVVTLANNTLREGTCTIVATKAGDATHYPADPIVINIAIATPGVVTTQLPDGEYRQNSEYTTTLVAGGGNGSNTWSLCSLGAGEQLPDGLTLNTSTGVISGTPTKAGVFSFKVCVTSNGILSDPQPLTIKISKASLTVYASSPTVTYRDAIPVITPTYEGFRSIADTETTTRPACVTAYVIGTGVSSTESSRRTTCSGAFDSNYTVTNYVNGVVTVNKMEITVTALNATKYNQVSGDTTTVFRDPALFYGMTPNLLPTETENDLYSGGLTISRASSGGALGGILTASLTTLRAGEVNNPYAITVSGLGTLGPNYNVTFVNGTFTVQSTLIATELVAATTDKRINYGQTLDGQLTADLRRVDTDGLVSSGITCVYKNGNDTLTSSTVLRPGTYTVTVECTSTDNTFVTTTFGSYKIVVDPAVLTIRALDTQKWQGTLDPGFEYEVVGSFIPDSGHTTATLGRVTLTRAPGEAIGEYAITPSGAGHPDYIITFQAGTLYIAKITITVQEQNGVLTSKTVACVCEGLKPDTDTTLKIFSTPTTITTVRSASDGTCPDLASQTIPASIDQGNHTLQVSSLYPTSVSLSTTRRVALLPAPPISPAEDDEDNGGGGGGGGGGGSIATTPVPPVTTPTTPRPGPNPNNARPTPPNFVPGAVVPGPSPTAPANPSAPSDPLAKGPTGTIADPLAAPALAAPPRLPGVFNSRSSVVPGAQGSIDLGTGATIPGAGFVAPNPANSTLDFGNGIEVAGSDASSSLESAKRTFTQLSAERISGFSPGSGLRIEILGARTGARFVLADIEVIDAVALIRAMEASITTQEANFSKITRVVRGERPLIQKAWSPEVREGIDEFFEAVGLEAPRALIDLDLTGVNNWVSVSAEVETYQPGSTVFLVATSSPIVLATAEVDQFGRAQLAGAMPVEALGTGEHRVRVVGIRSLEGVSVDDAGEIQLSAELMAEIQRFDLGTQSTIALSGLNPEGGYHSAIRVVPLVPVAPWWTLWFILAGFVLVLGTRYRRLLDTNSRRVIAASGVLASALPAVIIGWVSTVTSVVWVGILLGIVGAVISWFMPEQKKSARSK